MILMGERRDITGTDGRPGMGRVTISQVAAETGLAKGTVSRALNDYPDISHGTKQRVRAAARALGYTPMAHAQAIRTGRVRAVGLILQMEQHDAQRPFLADFLRGISVAASAEGWTLTVATAASQDEGLQTYRRLIADRKADGFILPRTLWVDPRAELLRAADVPFVMYGRTRDDNGCAWFDIRGEEAVRQAVLRLADLGHTRIAYLGGDPIYTFAVLRMQAFRDAMAEAGLKVEGDLIRDGLRDIASGEIAGASLLDGEARPTAIVGATDVLAVGAALAARARGLALGRDVSIIGYDGSPEGEMLDPKLTTYVVDQAAAGRRLTELLIARIRGEAPHRLRETAEAKLRIGGTDGPPNEQTQTLGRTNT